MRLTAFLVLSITVLGLSSCESYQKNSTHQNVSDESIKAGKQLAAVYCQSCHLLPDPSMLDAKSWEKGVLPRMGPMLGIFQNGFEEYPSYRNDRYLGKGFYPSEPLLDPGQWQQIIDYFAALAPDTIYANKNDEPISGELEVFSPEWPAFKDSASRISYIKINSSNSPNTLMLYEVNRRTAFRFDHQITPIDSIEAGTSFVDVTDKNSFSIVCNMGTIAPNNRAEGSINNYGIDSSGKMVFDSIPLIDSLRRPVGLSISDINADGKDDIVVCEYGNIRGTVSWFENKGDQKFTKHIIKEVPGAIKIWVNDINHDGLPDIYTLFAQGDESIFLFTNDGHGGFIEKRLLRFPAVYGSTYFEMADVNHDGFPDIVYTCGDNADYSPILKPYHGVYIFINDGNNEYTQKYFFHLNGCYKALARDFDNDGDLDIATISFFADFNNRPEEGFVYLENQGNLAFKPFSLAETQKGRWLTMDAGDLDADGKIDIVLGNFAAPMATKFSKKFEQAPPFLLLRNKIK